MARRFIIRTGIKVLGGQRGFAGIRNWRRVIRLVDEKKVSYQMLFAPNFANGKQARKTNG